MSDNKDKGVTDDSSIPADIRLWKDDETDDEGGIGPIT